MVGPGLPCSSGNGVPPEIYVWLQLGGQSYWPGLTAALSLSALYDVVCTAASRMGQVW